MGRSQLAVMVTSALRISLLSDLFDIVWLTTIGLGARAGGGERKGEGDRRGRDSKKPKKHTPQVSCDRC